MNHLRLGIDSKLSDVPLVAVAVNRVCLYFGLNAVQAGNVELCVVEASTNAIRHAYHNVPGRPVEVTVTVERDQLLIEVCDEGTPMPPDQVKRLTFGAPIAIPDTADRASLAEGGRGLQIIHELMDKAAYSSNAKKNKVIMTMRIPATSHSCETATR